VFVSLTVKEGGGRNKKGKLEISEGKINMKTHNGVFRGLYFTQVGRHQG